MSDLYEPPRRSWIGKFVDSFRGLSRGTRGESSFAVHFVVAIAVVVAAAAFHVSPIEWCLLVFCIATVIGAEFFNTSLESMAKAVTRQFDEHVRDALDMGSGAVLVVSLGAAVVGLIIFVPRLVNLITSG